MPYFTQKKSLYYNDVNLIARPCATDFANALGALSRKNIPQELNRIFVSPMQAVVGKKLAQIASARGLSVCLHRFPSTHPVLPDYGSVQGQLDIFHSLPSTENVFVAVGLEDIDRVKTLMANGVTRFLIDIANGYMDVAIAGCVKRMLDCGTINRLMVGNVHSDLGVYQLVKQLSFLPVPLDIRVGIAGGSPCSTSDSTGFNRGQITEIQECSEWRKLIAEEDLEKYKDREVRIIADGGIKHSGYASKAFGAGADGVMLGGYFSRAQEAETHISGDGTYWGGASEKQQVICKGKASRHSEGKELMIDEPLVPMDKLIDDLWGGISSAVSYGGFNRLKDFINQGVFEIKQNSLPPKRKG
jgi:hypothetical protein